MIDFEKKFVIFLKFRENPSVGINTPPGTEHLARPNLKRNNVGNSFRKIIICK